MRDESLENLESLESLESLENNLEIATITLLQTSHKPC